MAVQIVTITDTAALLADGALAQRVDELGARSALVRNPILGAQQLSRPITSAALFGKHASAQRQQLLLAVQDDQVVGFMKTGFKHLFYVNAKGVYTELDPLCVLDFYVLEEYQRHGVGLELFKHLLEAEHVEPAQLAYDRPSPKLIAFLQKHAQLTSFTPQPNNFVVFDAYFQNTTR